MTSIIKSCDFGQHRSRLINIAAYHRRLDEGTGPGLSMSYDIITKGHGGELKVDTKEGEFAEFKIIVPI